MKVGKFKAGKHALDQPVKADGGEIFAVGLHTHPAVVIEHVGLLAVGVDDVHQRLGLFRHEALDEIHIIPLVGRGRAVSRLQFALVDEVLRRQGVAVFLLKGPQGRRADGEIIAGPIHKAAAAAQIAAEDPDKIVEKRGQPHHVGIGIGFAPVFEPALQVLPGQGMAGVQLAQMLAGPMVGGVVVHVDLFPDAPDQEGRRIAMIGHAAAQGDFALRPLPLIPRHQGVGRPVPHLPVGQGVGAVVQLELLIKVSVQRSDLQRIGNSRLGIGGQEGLLLGVGMRLGKGVVLPDDADGGVDAVARLHDPGRQLGAVGIADHVRAPFFRHFQRQFLVSRFTRKREAALTIIAHIHSPIGNRLCLLFFYLYCTSPPWSFPRK